MKLTKELLALAIASISIPSISQNQLEWYRYPAISPNG